MGLAVGFAVGFAVGAGVVAALATARIVNRVTKWIAKCMVTNRDLHKLRKYLRWLVSKLARSVASETTLLRETVHAIFSCTASLSRVCRCFQYMR